MASDAIIEAVAGAILSEMSDRRLLNDVDEDLHEEIGRALAKASLGAAQRSVRTDEPVAYASRFELDRLSSARALGHKGQFGVQLANIRFSPFLVPLYTCPLPTAPGEKTHD